MSLIKLNVTPVAVRLAVEMSLPVFLRLWSVAIRTPNVN